MKPLKPNTKTKLGNGFAGRAFAAEIDGHPIIIVARSDDALEKVAYKLMMPPLNPDGIKNVVVVENKDVKK